RSSFDWQFDECKIALFVNVNAATVHGFSPGHCYRYRRPAFYDVCICNDYPLWTDEKSAAASFCRAHLDNCRQSALDNLLCRSDSRCRSDRLQRGCRISVRNEIMRRVKLERVVIRRQQIVIVKVVAVEIPPVKRTCRELDVFRDVSILLQRDPEGLLDMAAE